MRAPVTNSMISRMRSRISNAYMKIDCAPRSMACVPSCTKMAGDARELGEHHAQHLGARRDVVDAEQLLGREHVAQAVRERREIIGAIDDGDRLLPEKILGLLFDAGMKEADLGLRGDHRLAVEPQHHAQHAVRARMLRSHRQDERVALVAWRGRHICIRPRTPTDLWCSCWSLTGGTGPGSPPGLKRRLSPRSG